MRRVIRVKIPSGSEVRKDKKIILRKEKKRKKKKQEVKKNEKDEKKEKSRNERIIDMKKVVEEQKIWDEKEKVAKLEEEAKKLVSPRFHRWVYVFRKKVSERMPVEKI